jgi:SAM-dependent methyltransferase
MKKTITGRMDDWPLLRSEKLNTHGQERMFSDVNRKLAPGDGMYDNNDSYYLEVGASALQFVHLSLSAADRKASEIKVVLDYACGFGRVLRWLCAAFPEAQIVAADADPKAVSAVSQLFDVTSFTLDRTLTEEIGNNFDLIWVGSLATHLPQEGLEALVLRLGALLSIKGVLVLTTHGSYVADRIARAEKTYGLDSAGISTLISGYECEGYGFASYPQQKSYGIAVCKTSRLLQMLESAKLYPILYRERAWVRHQDCVAAVRAPSPGPPLDRG